MPSLYDPILTHAGLLQGGKLSQAAKDRYVIEVLALLATGNADGQGGSPFTRVFSSLVPLPPVPGPKVFDPSTLRAEQLFWFDADPLAAIMSTQLPDRANNPVWHAVFIDLLYEKTAVSLDIPGTTPLFPIFDVSVPFGGTLPIPFTPPDLAALLKVTPPDLAVKLAGANLALSLPIVPVPPLPPVLPAPIDLSVIAHVPGFRLIDLLIGLIRLPFDVMAQLVLPPSIDLVATVKLPALPGVVLNIAIGILLDLLVSLGMVVTVPKIFIASLLIYLKNVVGMLCTDIVGMLLGAGDISNGIAGLTGLV